MEESLAGIWMNPVEGSSHIAALGFDYQKEILAVLFVNDDLYHYSNVPVGLYDEFLNAKSKGVFFFKCLRRHRDLYPGVKVEYDQTRRAG
jgi:hypothetical protein